jgi:hypothetical protein
VHGAAGDGTDSWRDEAAGGGRFGAEFADTQWAVLTQAPGIDLVVLQLYDGVAEPGLDLFCLTLQWHLHRVPIMTREPILSSHSQSTICICPI